MSEVNWEKVAGLVPAIVQDVHTGMVLMLAYMNPEALEKTKASGWVTFYSRSKQALWVKGETSGNKLKLVKILSDCDQDTLLILAEPMGPACHNGTTTCFAQKYQGDWAFLSQLEKIIVERKAATPDQSYTAKLFNEGVKRIAQKVGEEGVETALAAMTDDAQELNNEAADLIFHLLVLLQAKNSNLKNVISILQNRHK